MRRFDQYMKALSVLSRASEQDLENEFIQSGIIDKFSLQFELGWKMLKDLRTYIPAFEALGDSIASQYGETLQAIA